MKIKITEEMKLIATDEANKRNPHIKHHFEVEHLTGTERDIIGFCGEFACCEMLGINWKTNIRENYILPDDFDLVHRGKKIDVKTETVPGYPANQIINGERQDDWKGKIRFAHE